MDEDLLYRYAHNLMALDLKYRPILSLYPIFKGPMVQLKLDLTDENENV